MKLTQEELSNNKLWEEAGFELPKFDRDKMIKNTKENPEWIHFGAGNIFRAFPAAVCQDLLNRGILNTGIIVAEGYDYEIIEKSYKKYDDLNVLVTLKVNGTLEKKVIGSIAESLCVDTNNSNDWNRLKEIFKSNILKMVSFTITEKGYSLKNGKDEFLKDVDNDFKNGPSSVTSYMGKLVALCYERFKCGRLPLTLVSMDNCSHNGTKLENAIKAFAKHWVDNKLVEAEFLTYVSENISYPWTMIDKITPRPAQSVINMLKEAGFEDTEAIMTSKNTYIAPFVNAEEPQYLVIEDNFKNGGLPLDKGGIIYTNKETVDKVEKMKVCTCLNPLHTALAIYGCLLSYTKISDEMKDDELVTLIKNVGYKEGLPVVVNPKIISPNDFIDEVMKVRLPNPFMPDTPQRIACDTSQKLGIRFGETIKAYVKSSELDVKDLTFIPLVIAGWCRYLMAIDDKGNKFELSPDPLLSSVTPIIDNVKLGNTENIHETLIKILSNKAIFGVDLYEVGLGEKIENYFKELIAGEGAIRSTLKKYCK
ncbi:fructuronate reductase [Clostridium tetanomorphum]|uniref:Mannitol dehydrogenase family protein n=1 Tax=Clostridium tetanomorphum TaxID=1553 RepID=A0A923E5P9_CLOTT|nr:mannitol dehydrogenase family protein [Clostridium tetanomorphum]KAJ52608.1 oxidoreductase [Clostridium tetanomorphum DSM 665]MBC2396838.1 mannitol dehydrogenase family protein [Clostridium tetanomorphum]MBP1863200.1 fructuronate reductase [Clostridium tetanomorphum]NRS84308.1 fructuronate reductase [Clostridium tetanomorphum]NRZ97522.1 fructuronate reductase [Clostridium tetanomorphum]